MKNPGIQSPPRPLRQRGFSLLETALVVLLVGSAITAGFLVLRARQPVEQVRAQEQALQWADQALLAYAAQHARLPCAVATPTSDAGDCVAPGLKGWLPVRALEAIHPGGNRPGQPLRYMVYRGGSDSDLAVAANLFNPHKWDDSEHAFDAINGVDLCQALANAARAGIRGDRARTTGIDGSTVNVAYGLSAAGPTPGESGRYDGLNQQSAAVMESPARGVDSGYDDRVRVRDFNALARSLGCGYAIAAAPDGLVPASLDLLALAVDVSDEVDEQHAGNKEDTDAAVVMAGISEAFAVLGVALSAANVSNSASTLATASAQLSAAIASCVILIGCALIPTYTAAVIAGGVAVGLAAVATGLAATALGLTSAALAETVVAEEMADKPIQRGAANLEELIEQACKAAEGGWVDQKADDDGNLYDVEPFFEPGLKQEVEDIKKELDEIDKEIAEAQVRLDVISSFQVPWPYTGWLIDKDYHKPTQGKEESDEDYQKRYDAWADALPEQVQKWEKILTAKLEAIEKAERARAAWKLAEQEEKDAASQLSRMETAISNLRTDKKECEDSPPADRVEIMRCNNAINSLEGLLDCESEFTSIIEKDGYMVRQCKADMEKAAEEAKAASKQAYKTFSRLQYKAAALDQPPLNNYISQDWLCWMYGGCSTLIIPMQDFEDDERETYAGTYYKKLELQNLRVLKEQELADKEAAYAEAKAQCEALRNMDPANGSGEPLPVWGGADAILKAANCRGATGPVQPVSCAVES